jgi:amylosucrase
LLLHAVILTIGGIPLIYLGDEIGTLNDYSYRSDPAKAHDSRWVHRPKMDWDKVDRRNDPTSIEGQIFQGMQKLIRLRKSQAAFTGGEMQVIRTDSVHILGYLRSQDADRIVVFANFSENAQIVPANLLRLYGLSYQYTDLLTQQPFAMQDIVLDPFQFLCLKA